MKSLNQVQLIGNLGSDPESKEYDGKLVSRFSIATGEEWLNKETMAKENHTEWHKIVCFNKLADIVDRYLKKGARVYISGKLKTSKWKTDAKEDRYSTEIIVDELIMLDNKISN